LSISIERHEVPIEIRALKTANVYIVDDNIRILIDTGMSDISYRALVFQGVYFKDIDYVFITHLHIDHIGSAGRIREEFGIPLAMGEADVARVDSIRADPGGFNRYMIDRMRMNGTPDGIIEQMIQHHAVLDHLDTYTNLEIDNRLKGGERISDGTEVIHNPGHSPGSLSLYVKETDSILTGDHILPGITPNISPYDDSTDMLGLYLGSLEKTMELNAGFVYPGHRSPFENANQRIVQIIDHHKQRIDEILFILDSWKSSYEVAGSMTWSRNRGLSSMNLMEMNFAIGEAESHLMHMEAAGLAERRERNGLIQYRRTT
jgi:glyoxylase-like metal-dependent hydrolase (beta-lactamase superfamily II)